MKASVYLETTILSYLVARPSRDLVVAAHQQITREWWDKHVPHFRCYVSQIVVDEISKGDPVESKKRQEVAGKIPLLDVTDDAAIFAEELLGEKILPLKATQDATHIAVAAVNGLDFLLTWNCVHIANAKIEGRIATLCRSKGFQPPVICTPEQLMIG
ncbi:MAG: type II toxin-antitoxin system VapC family toxin [Verrucomicrobiia bacterium]